MEECDRVSLSEVVGEGVGWTLTQPDGVRFPWFANAQRATYLLRARAKKCNHDQAKHPGCLGNDVGEGVGILYGRVKPAKYWQPH